MKSRDVTDRGWAWVVLAAAFINLLIGPGLSIVGGIFQTVFLEHFKESVALTAWVTSLFSSSLQLAGPLSSFIASQYNCRVSVMAGAALLALGLVVSSLLDDIRLLLYFMGIISGIGMGLTYSASIVIVNLYFVKKRNLVTGIALSATGVGTFAFPILCRYLLDIFSWRETLIILAALALQMSVCGALMFPVHEKRASCVPWKLVHLKKSKPEQTRAQSLDKKLGQSDAILGHCSYEMEIKVDTVDDDASCNSVNFNRRDRRPTYDSDSSRSLFCNVGFLLLCLNLLLVNSAFGVVLIHFPSFCISTGTPPSQAAFYMSLSGLALTISRTVLGAAGNDTKIDSLMMYIGLLICSSVLTVCSSLFTSSTMQWIAWLLFGTYLGGCYTFLTTITIDFVGIEKLAVALGWEMISAGAGYLVAPPLAGLLVDTLGTYTNALILSGACMLLSVFVAMCLPVCGRRMLQRQIPGERLLIVQKLEATDN